MEITELVGILQKHNIDVQSFGKGKAKKADELLGEIANGETVLSVNPKGELQRNIRTLAIDVKCRDAIGRALILYEASRRSHDGRDLSRKQRDSITEKLLAAEEADANSVARALKEELGITNGYQITAQSAPKMITRISSTYPGLLTECELHKFTVWLDKRVFKPEGYIEDDGRKVTEFKWKRQWNPFW